MLEGTDALLGLLGVIVAIIIFIVVIKVLLKKAAEKDAAEQAEFIKNLPSAQFINKLNNEGLTPLIKAIIHGWDEALERILDLNPDPNTKDSSGEPPIMLAIRFNRLELAKRLQQLGADPTIKNQHEQSCLWFAAALGYQESFEWLYQFDKEINQMDIQLKMTPLMVAGYNGKIGMVNHLLSIGADPSIQNPDGKTAASIAEEFIGNNMGAYKNENDKLYQMIASLKDAEKKRHQ